MFYTLFWREIKGSGDREFMNPCGITVDSLGNLYVSDTYNHRLVVL